MKSTNASKHAVRANMLANVVATANKNFQDQLSGELDRFYAEVLRENETMPDWKLIQDLDTRILSQWAARAMAEDRARRDAVAGRKELRGHVMGLAAAVRAQLHGARNQVRGKYGSAALALVGLDVRLAREPIAVLEQAEHVRGRLSDPELRLPAPKPGVRALDPAQLAAELTADTEALATALADLREARLRGKEMLLERRQALADLRVRYLSLTGQLVHRFRLTGLEEVAEAIRSLLRARNSPTPDPEPEPEPVPNDDAPAPERVMPA